MRGYVLTGITKATALARKLRRGGWFVAVRGRDIQYVYAVGPDKPWAILHGHMTSVTEVRECALTELPAQLQQALPREAWTMEADRY